MSALVQERTPGENEAVKGRVRRRIGTILLVLGFLALVYGATIYFWRDPVTDLYARWKQHQLSDQLDKTFADYRASVPIARLTPDEAAAAAEQDTAGSPTEPPEGSDTATPKPAAEEAANRAVEEAIVREAATSYFRSLELGQPLGRISIPKLDIDPVFVNGTRWGGDLSRGPGRYPETFLPGMGRVTAIAGHRTTFGAPFRHIDRLKRGDEITLVLPYGTFRYLVTAHEIVDDEDWSVIEPQGGDTLVLSACHPLYSASQRWIVYARLASVEMPDGQALLIPEEDQSVAARTG